MLKLLNDGCVVGAVLVTMASLWRHLKNYRKPMDQRLIVRILMMVPLFALAAWTTLYAPTVARLVVPLSEVYEALVIYTFYTLLTNLLGGERDIIFMCTGRPPLRVWWPLCKVVRNVDISDPHTFLLIKRCVMQFLWFRLLTCILFILFPTGTGWVVVTVIFNVSMTIALNALSLFWVCLYQDLKPYNVMLKFLNIKLIVFFSYWQNLVISILGQLGVFKDPETLVLCQNSLLCVEMVFFSFGHWVAFPSSDYATTALIGFGRLALSYAFFDAFGGRDLFHDFTHTFLRSRNTYYEFDSVEAVLDHPESRTRQARLAAGLRYRNRGRSRYWLPEGSIPRKGQRTYGATDSDDVPPSSFVPRTDTWNSGDEEVLPYCPILWDEDDIEGDEHIYLQARLMYGDYNYPVLTVRESIPYITIEERERCAGVPTLLADI